MRNAFIFLLAAMLGSAAFGQDRPNVIFFLTDDQRNDFLGCTGHPIIVTPVIDGLARKGVRFENAFVTTSICAASRASLFTGRYERTHGYTFGTPPIHPNHSETSYPAELKKNGYYTGFVGKFGVNVRKGAREAMFDSFVPLNRNPYFKKQPDGSERHVTEIAGDKAIEFLQEAKEKEGPFCLSVSFNASHAEDGDKKNHFPYPKAVAGLYGGLEMPTPRYPDPATYESQPEFLKNSLNRERYFWRWDTPEKYQHNMRNYLRMISGIDGVIGRVLGELRALGMAGNTVVIYMADNGYYAGSRGFAGKWSHYEESLRVPLIIFDPRLEKGKRGRILDEMALNVDIAPTILGYAGVDQPDGYQGRALQPLIAGSPVDSWRTDFFCEHLMIHKGIPKWEGVRDQRYVYARYFEQKPVFEFLHDLNAEPRQFQNLASDAAHSATLEKLRARCDSLRDEYQSAAPRQASVEELIGEAQKLAREGDVREAAQSIGFAIRKEPSARLYLLRARFHSDAGNYRRAIGDYTSAIEMVDDAGKPALREQRGVTRFFHGQMKEAIADFDAFIAANPGREPYHWQRGLAYYYAGEFEKGRVQFEAHQTVNTNDVENAAWHFLCVARIEGVEKAREHFIPIEGDSRIPMKEVHQLFAGKATPENVLAAASADDSDKDALRNHLCYAHLYLGLYFEALGDKEKSQEHIKKSAAGYRMDHYMGKTAQVHWKLRK